MGSTFMHRYEVCATSSTACVQDHFYQPSDCALISRLLPDVLRRDISEVAAPSAWAALLETVALSGRMAVSGACRQCSCSYSRAVTDLLIGGRRSVSSQPPYRPQTFG